MATQDDAAFWRQKYMELMVHNMQIIAKLGGPQIAQAAAAQQVAQQVGENPTAAQPAAQNAGPQAQPVPVQQPVVTQKTRNGAGTAKAV